MRIVHGSAFMIVIAVSMMVAGCAPDRDFQAQGVRLSSDEPLAVIPFDALSGNPNAGLILSRLLWTELAATNAFKLVSCDQVEKKLAPLEGKTVSPQELAEILGAGRLLLGSVLEYRYKRGIAQEPLIGLNLRLIKAESGKLIWSTTRTRVGRHSWIREDSLSRLARDMCRDIASTLAQDKTHD